MKFSGTISGMAVQILLDSGSSDNFLQPRIAKCLKLPIEIAPKFPSPSWKWEFISC